MEDHDDGLLLSPGAKDKKNGGAYAWEAEYKRSWDVLLDEDEGTLQGMLSTYHQQLLLKKKRLGKDTNAVQRGIIRHVYLVLDMSKSMTETDIRPTRMECTFNFVSAFIHEFFDQNPLSHLGIIGMRDGLCEKWSEMCGNPSDLIQAIKMRKTQEPSGEPSLQNAFGLARTSLAHAPSHGSREIIVIYGSLTSNDPGNIMETIADLKSERIRVSIVGLSAEVFICKKIATETRGSYAVVLGDNHFRDLLFEHIPPPPIVTADQSSCLIQMGFPSSKTFENLTLCACHSKPIRVGYICPRCESAACELPMDCHVCALTLVSSPSLARSYHHLFPVPSFLEVPQSHSSLAKHCQSCQASFPEFLKSKSTNSGRFACPHCHSQFCLECDVFIHQILHNCPGCSTGIQIAPLR